MSNNIKGFKVDLLKSPENYFSELVLTAFEKRRLEPHPRVSDYLVNLLSHYLISSNLTVNSSFAETLLKAIQAERTLRLEMLKKLGDTSLYISGFFGDSLRRKIVDIDYYADIGGAAYASLANEVAAEEQALVYTEFSERFLDYVDILTYISQSAQVQSNQDLLRLYERYVLTGSELAKEQLIEKGLLTGEQLKKSSNQ